MEEGSSSKLLVLYASQTGTAQEVAERIGREGKRRHFAYRVSSMDEYPVQKLVTEELVVIVAATTGQGDPPDNMKKFWRFLLRKDLPLDSLTHVKIAVLGLGDSSYIKFNHIAKKLYRRFIQLGAKSVQDIGLADDQHPAGLDGVADPWIQLLWKNVLTLWPLPPGKEIILSTVRPSSRFRVIHCNDQASKSSESGYQVNGVEDSWCQSHPFMSHILENKRVTASDHFQDVRLITFDLEGSGINYSPGDVLMIQPRNVERAVNEFLLLLNLDPGSCIKLEQNDPDFQVPEQLDEPRTMLEVFERHLDIQGVPKRYFFELLAHFTTSELEKERLQEFSSAEGQEDLLQYCHRQRRTYYETLQDFPIAAANIPLDYVFDLIPPLKPRAFSIASSQKLFPNSVQILMAVVNYKTKMKRPRQGVCSTWLSEIQDPSFNKEEIPVWINKGSFSFPKAAGVPLIMVGPGTGCAPFRSYLQEWSSKETQDNRDCCLFFGCRGKEKDFFFKDEWAAMSETTRFSLFTAFSRDQEDKIYVQHVMEKQGPLIWNLVKRGAYFCIAGNAKQMPTDVMGVLKKIVKTEGKLSEQDGEQFMKMMELNRRLQCETWS